MIARVLKVYAPLVVVVVVCPYAGLALSGADAWLQVAVFPPRVHVAHAPFSWWVFGILALLIAACVAPLIRWLLAPGVGAEARHGQGKFPCWGWGGLVLLGVAWTIAWQRFEWARSLQLWTFTPIWLGYIVLVNAVTTWRTGRCPAADDPLRFALLFPLSAAFWWLFEYLNRFIQNWYYADIPEFSALGYLWFASLPFSTVLPAVLSTQALLASFDRFDSALIARARLPLGPHSRLAWLALGLNAVVLLLIGVWPDYLFPFVWLAPLIILVALQMLNGQPTVVDDLANGDWRVAVQAAGAGLVCGFLWELWNAGSLAKWQYSVPFVHDFEIFAMPALGYAGYLPFGIECIAVSNLLVTARPSARLASEHTHSR